MTNTNYVEDLYDLGKKVAFKINEPLEQRRKYSKNDDLYKLLTSNVNKLGFNASLYYELAHGTRDKFLEFTRRYHEYKRIYSEEPMYISEARSIISAHGLDLVG